MAEKHLNKTSSFSSCPAGRRAPLVKKASVAQSGRVLRREGRHRVFSVLAGVRTYLGWLRHDEIVDHWRCAGRTCRFASAGARLVDLSRDARKLFDGMMLSGVVPQTSQGEKTRMALWLCDRG
ncbi:hypothetical protein SEVIR_7G208250v4 [Setaria viridis]